jgi:hypothetical protein
MARQLRPNKDSHAVLLEQKDNVRKNKLSS